MRVQIVDNAGFAVIAKLEPSNSPAGHYSMELLTKWAGAKVPHSEQVKASVILDRAGLSALRDLIDSINTDGVTARPFDERDQLRLIHVAYQNLLSPLDDEYRRARDDLLEELGDGPEFRQARNALWEDHCRQRAAAHAQVWPCYERARDALQRELRGQRT